MFFVVIVLLFIGSSDGFFHGTSTSCSTITSRSTSFKPSSEQYQLRSPQNQAGLKSTLSKDFANIQDQGSYEVIEAEGSGSPCRIKVIGVGGGGGNAVNRMMESSTGVLGVELWVVNTDAQALSRSLTPNRLTIGSTVSRGLGAGGSPAVGARAAEESRDEIMQMVKGADLVFVTAGMGGGTGSGAAPIVAECAKEAGALTVGVVTKPFGFEGRKRMQQAKEAILALKDRVDTLIVVSNDKLLQIVPENTPLTDAFLVADDILRQGVVGISEIIVKPGLVNVDFADVRTIMGNAGTALMGIGTGKGKTRATDAAMAAISSPLLDFPIARAKGIVFNIVGGSDMTLQEINAAAEVIYENVDADANIIFGALVDDKLNNGEVSITVLATGFATDFYSDQNDNNNGNTAKGQQQGNKGGVMKGGNSNTNQAPVRRPTPIATTPAQGISKGAPQLSRIATPPPPPPASTSRGATAAAGGRGRRAVEAEEDSAMDEYENGEEEDYNLDELNGDDLDADDEYDPRPKRGQVTKSAVNNSNNRYSPAAMPSNSNGNRLGRRMVTGNGNNGNSYPSNGNNSSGGKKKRGGIVGFIKRLFGSGGDR